jgi:hypothetical protein
VPRFNAALTEKVYWVPTIASVTAPTSAEITAGQNLTSIKPDSISGFSLVRGQVEGYDISSPVATTADSNYDVTDLSFQIFANSTTGSSDVTQNTLLAEGSAGYLLFALNGSVATAAKVEIWPVTIRGNNVADTRGTNAIQTRLIQFSSTAPPTKNAVVA